MVFSSFHMYILLQTDFFAEKLATYLPRYVYIISISLEKSAYLFSLTYEISSTCISIVPGSPNIPKLQCQDSESCQHCSWYVIIQGKPFRSVFFWFGILGTCRLVE